MGNSSPNSQLSILSDSNIWHIKDKGPLGNKFINIQTFQLATECFLNYQDTQQMNREVLIYDYRKNSPNFVRAMFLQKVQDSFSCYSSIRCRVLIQYIRLRLSMVGLASAPQINYVLLECLLGYQQIFRRFGYVEIDRDMIGINSKGRVKIWMNKNFLKNYKDDDSALIQDSLTRRQRPLQNSMVKKIVRVINKQITEPEYRIPDTHFEGGFAESINYLTTLMHNEQAPVAKSIDISKYADQSFGGFMGSTNIRHSGQNRGASSWGGVRVDLTAMETSAGSSNISMSNNNSVIIRSQYRNGGGFSGGGSSILYNTPRNRQVSIRGNSSPHYEHTLATTSYNQNVPNGNFG